MAVKLEDMMNEVSNFTTITSNKIIDFSGSSSVLLPSGVVTSANIGNGIIKGSNTTLTKFYPAIAVNTTGTTAVNLFGSSTAPTACSITGFFVSAAASTTAGSVTLWGTTAGTVAFIEYGTTIGTMTGTSVLSAAILAGDTVTIKSSTAGTAVAYVTLKTSA